MVVKNKYIIALFLIFLVSMFSDIMWLSKEALPPGWDESLHLTKSLQYYDTIMATKWETLINIDNYYPPFYHLSTFIPYTLFGTSEDSAIFVNILFFGILMLSVYGVGKHFGGVQAGVIGALLLALYPGVIGIRRFFVIDNGVIAIVALSIYMLVLTDKFKNTKFTIYFGIVSAVAMLSKWTAVFFIAIPFLVMCYEAFWKEKRRPSLGFIGMVVIGVLLTMTWYWAHFMDVYRTITWGNVYWGTLEGDPDVFSFDSFVFYAKALINSQISLVFFLVALAGVIKFRKNLFLIGIIALPYVIMTLMKNKNERYTMPSLVAVAVLSGLWIASIKKDETKVVLLAIIVGVGVGQLGILGLNADFKPMNIAGVDILSSQIYGTRPADNSDWKTTEIVDTLSGDIQRSKKNRVINVGTVVDHPYVNGLSIGYYAYMKKLPVNSISVTDFEATQPFVDNFYRFDYLILKTGQFHMVGRKQIMIEMNQYFYDHQNGWIPIGKYDLPDGSNATVYKNTMVSI